MCFNKRRHCDDDMMDSALFKLLAIGAIVYAGAKAWDKMMDR